MPDLRCAVGPTHVRFVCWILDWVLAQFRAGSNCARTRTSESLIIAAPNERTSLKGGDTGRRDGSENTGPMSFRSRIIYLLTNYYTSPSRFLRLEYRVSIGEGRRESISYRANNRGGEDGDETGASSQLRARRDDSTRAQLQLPLSNVRFPAAKKNWYTPDFQLQYHY